MEIDNVRKEDSGTYICTASNNVGTISADQIELKVLCKFFSHHYVAKFLVNFHTFFTYDTQTNFISTLSTRKNPYLLDNAGAPF